MRVGLVGGGGKDIDNVLWAILEKPTRDCRGLVVVGGGLLTQHNVESANG